MAGHKSSRLSRSRPTPGSSNRRRRFMLPLLEGLENRVVLSRTPSLLPPSVAELATAAVVSTTDNSAGFVPVRLANGSIAWMEGTPASRLPLPASSGSATGTTLPAQAAIRAVPGAILGSLPVSSPLENVGDQGALGPAGYIPEQIQVAYGLSTGAHTTARSASEQSRGMAPAKPSAFTKRATIPALSIRQTRTTAQAHSRHSTKPSACRTRPASHSSTTRARPCRQPTTAATTRISRITVRGSRLRSTLNGRTPWRPVQASSFFCAVPDANNYYEDIPLGIATLAGLPGISVISASYAWYLDYFGVESLEQSWDSTIIGPASRRTRTSACSRRPETIRPSTA